MLATLAAYFLLLVIVSRRSSRRGRNNDAFFRAGRRSPWWMVAFGMIGASISGVTFISVPAWAATTGFTYLQMCLGFIVGYLVVAFVLLPLYYRLGLTSIYSYLGERFGRRAHSTGAAFFVVSKLLGGAARLYLVCLVLTTFVTKPFLGDNLWTFLLTAGAVLLLIWLYTRRSGIQTIVRTDALQTLCLLLAAGGIFWLAASRMGLDVGGVLSLVRESPMTKMWEWNPSDPQAFWRQFLSGAFIVIVMTGLDQDMMQKNLTCVNLRSAQKNMVSYGLAFLPVNAFFLALGVVLFGYCDCFGITPGATGDGFLPWMISSGALGNAVIIPFTIGIVAAAFSSADSALTSLTTTVCVDLLGAEGNDARAVSLRRRVHLWMVAAFFACLVVFRLVGNENILNAIYVMASYSYGPLLGLYAFGLFTSWKPNDRLTPWVCLLAPLLCAVLEVCSPLLWGYTFGYELLVLNGLLTACGLYLIRSKRERV